MTFTELICRLASERFDGPAQLGVRLSPVALEPEEARQLIEDAQRCFGGRRVFVAAAVPGAEEETGETWCISATELAAERATAWRNTVDTDAGERVLYVSVTRQGKAGGLRDTLYSLTEQELRDCFVRWCERSSALPDSLGEALAAARLAERADARALCAYSEAVLAAQGAEQRWVAAGVHLPILSLAVDTMLRDAPTERLRANARWVRGVATTDKRHKGSLTPSAREVRAALKEAITEAAGCGSVESILRDIDIGSLSSEDLGSDVATKTSSRRSVPRATAVSKPARKPTRRSHRSRRIRDRQQAVEEELACLQSPAPTPKSLVESEREPEAPELVGERESSTDPAKKKIWTEGMQRREFGSSRARLPTGLRALLVLSLSSEQPLTWTLKSGAPRKLLGKRTTSEAPQAAPELELSRWSAAHTRRTEARQALIELLDPGGHRGALELLVRAPLLALQDSALHYAATQHIEATAQLLAQVSRDAPELARQVLALETITLEAEAEETLCLLTPLHPLWLGQLLARLGALRDGKEISVAARRLLARSLTRSIATPPLWPLGEHRWLGRSAPAESLPVFESSPSIMEPVDIKEVTAQLLALHLQLHPHALAGLRLTTAGRGLQPVVEAASELLRDEERLTQLDLHLPRPTEASAELHRGRLRLLPLSFSGEGAPSPHLHIQLALHDTAQPLPRTVPLPSLKALERVCWQDSRLGLCQAISLAGVVGAEGVACLLQQCGATHHPTVLAETVTAAHFHDDDPEHSLAPVTWRVTLGAALRGRPKLGELLVVRERVGSVDVVITTADARPLSRRLSPVFQLMGVNSRRPSTLQKLTRSLSGVGSGGLLSLSGGSSERLLSARLLAHCGGTTAGPGALAVTLQGELYETLLGAEEHHRGGDSVVLAATVRAGEMHLVCGYAAIQQPLELDLSGARLTGPLWDCLARLADFCSLLTEDSPGGAAAWEAAGALFWPAVAAAPGQHRALAARLSRRPEHISFTMLCMLPGDHPLHRRSRPPRLRGSAVQIIAITPRLLEDMLVVHDR